ncbi:MAG TPA: DNA topoisomerase IB [Chloroflexota bacterium]|nr:DNA topoisomerase IB [Chloroflexota bacterium]
MAVAVGAEQQARNEGAPSATSATPVESAQAAGLRYVSDARPGIRRKRAGRHFRYVGPDGQPVHDPAVLQRIKTLAIPPAWTDVWICPDPNGHVQATARDAKGRKQYRYHPRWQAVRDETKYERTIAFGQALPLIHEQTERHLQLPGLPREKVLAAVVRLLETTLIRVGNDEYARNNHSFGLTTMRDRHVDVEGGKMRFHFRGKSGKQHTLELRDQRLARIVQRCRDIPGQELFQYIDDNGERRDVGSGDVNEYLREITGQDFTAKDFRTWAGTVLAAWALQEFEAFDSETQAKKNVVRAIERVAERLGNTPAVCRRCYVHPAVLEAYLDGSLAENLKDRVEGELTERLGKLPPEEAAVLVFLQHRLAQSGAQSSG